MLLHLPADHVHSLASLTLDHVNINKSRAASLRFLYKRTKSSASGETEGGACIQTQNKRTQTVFTNLGGVVRDTWCWHVSMFGWLNGLR